MTRDAIFYIYASARRTGRSRPGHADAVDVRHGHARR